MYQYDYYNVRLLAKFGMIWQLDPLTLGFNLTTPSINLFGKGSSYINLTKSARQMQDDSLDTGILIADYQDRLNSYYNNSFRLGLGISYEFGKSRLHLSAEWFNEVPEFDILEPKPFYAQSEGDTLQNQVSQKLRSVLNYGIGYEQHVSDVVAVYASFIIDHNANKEAGPFDLFEIDKPIYHVATGANIKIGTTYLTTGLAFSYANHTLESSNLIEDTLNQQDLESNLPELKGKQKYFRIKLIVSASFQL